MGFFHVVAQGEGISLIAERYGFAPNDLWTHANNTELARLRDDPDVLLPGDRVYIPDKLLKFAEVKTGNRHVFQRVGVPAKFRLQLYVHQQPRSRQEYRLVIDESTVLNGVTDDDGILEVWISPRAQHGILSIGPDKEELEIDFGCMDPLTEVIGVQKRLCNLGYLPGPPSGELDEVTVVALATFQEDCGLPRTGELDSRTREQLGAVHDAPFRFPTT